MMESQEIPVVNLEYGKPFVADAPDRLNEELIFAKQNGTRVVKFIHGYGSSGKGGRIKAAVQEELELRKNWGDILTFVRGEDFSPFTQTGRELLYTYPASAKDDDYCRGNPGVSIVVLW